MILLELTEQLFRKPNSLISFYLRIFWIAGGITLVFLLALYVFQVNDLAKKVYNVSQFQRKINTLSLENKNSELNLSASNSLVNIENQMAQLNLEKINQIKYIKVLVSQVAKVSSQTVRP